MPSFFEKLKRGMGLEGPPEEVTKEVKKKRIKTKAPQKIREPEITELKIEKKPIELEVEEVREIEKPEIKEEGEPKEEIKKPEVPSRRAAGELESFALSAAKAMAGKKATEGKEKWFEPEGQLAIDVYQTETDLVIQSAIAGVRPETLDITMERDVISIKGSREKLFEEAGDYFTQECYWGPFSREVILPVEVDPDRAEATMKEGILTIRIPKILKEKKRKIKVKV